MLWKCDGCMTFYVSRKAHVIDVDRVSTDPMLGIHLVFTDLEKRFSTHFDLVDGRAPTEINVLLFAEVLEPDFQNVNKARLQEMRDVEARGNEPEPPMSEQHADRRDF